MADATGKQTRPDYGVDAPGAMRNILLVGLAFTLFAAFASRHVHFGPVTIASRPFYATGAIFLIEWLLFLLYVKYGKMRHRDFMLAMHPWTGNEQVLDVGCGRGLLLVGAAKRIAALHGAGHVTGIDIWSNVDMGGNSVAATQRNLQLEEVTSLCTLQSIGAQEMPFPDAIFDVIVSNLCLHNIYDRPTRLKALQQIVRVLKPGGIALISDFKHTRNYASVFAGCGLIVERKRGSFITTFPPLTVVIARKPPL